MKKKTIAIAAMVFVIIFVWLYVVTTPDGGTCCDMPEGTSPEIREKTYNEYLWWERKRNFKKLFRENIQ